MKSFSKRRPDKRSQIIDPDSSWTQQDGVRIADRTLSRGPNAATAVPIGPNLHSIRSGGVVKFLVPADSVPAKFRHAHVDRDKPSHVLTALENTGNA